MIATEAEAAKFIKNRAEHTKPVLTVVPSSIPGPDGTRVIVEGVPSGLALCEREGPVVPAAPGLASVFAIDPVVEQPAGRYQIGRRLSKPCAGDQ
jgi:hypothetical protein